MKNIVTTLVLLISFTAFSQFNYKVSKENLFGKYNPTAPKQLLDYQDLIGENKCTSISRNPDRTWAKPVHMKWVWKYIMNGMGVQDETLKMDGTHSGSIRQYDKDSLRWNVHYYTSRATVKQLPVWHGNKKDGKIVLYKEQPASNGMKGFYRLTFYDITKRKFKWIGEWVDEKETIAFPTWKIECEKIKN
ncbi:MAG: hypothetical protein HWD85_12625 [Flavobacteriaceae bacterium]|nr:hypothetical protein [Flavobacteriaceae bacterium]